MDFFQYVFLCQRFQIYVQPEGRCRVVCGLQCAKCGTLRSYPLIRTVFTKGDRMVGSALAQITAFPLVKPQKDPWKAQSFNAGILSLAEFHVVKIFNFKFRSW